MSESSGSGGADASNERVGVRTYVPAWQRAAWKDHAEELEMSQSEFVRVMVQAGRSDLDIRGSEQSGPSNRVETHSEDVTPGGETLEEGVVELLDREGPLGWDELVEGLAGDFEERLESTLDELQSANRVKYSGRAGGYVVDDGR
jgi:hypothetical protein